MTCRKKGHSIHIITKSISYETQWAEVKSYFDKAFPVLASVIGKSTDEMVIEAKRRMKSHRKICAGCGKHGIHRHHLFEQTIKARELYGKLLDDEKNTVFLCDDCHEWKSVEHISEKEFCKRLNIQTRSKYGKL